MTPEQQKVIDAQVLKIMGLVVSHETITNMTPEFILESRKAIKSAIYEAIAIMEAEPNIQNYLGKDISAPKGEL